MPERMRVGTRIKITNPTAHELIVLTGTTLRPVRRKIARVKFKRMIPSIRTFDISRNTLIATEKFALSENETTRQLLSTVRIIASMR
jgi:hypothetical protein